MAEAERALPTWQPDHQRGVTAMRRRCGTSSTMAALLLKYVILLLVYENGRCLYSLWESNCVAMQLSFRHHEAETALHSCHVDTNTSSSACVEYAARLARYHVADGSDMKIGGKTDELLAVCEDKREQLRG